MKDTKLILNIIHTDGKFEQVLLTDLKSAIALCTKYLSDEQPKVDEATDTSVKASQRIIQIMEVLKGLNTFIKENDINFNELNEDILNNIITNIYKNVASRLNITMQTIADKAQRQLGYSKKEFVYEVYHVFINCKSYNDAVNSPLLKQIYEKACKSIADRDYVNSVMKEIFL